MGMQIRNLGEQKKRLAIHYLSTRFQRTTA